VSGGWCNYCHGTGQWGYGLLTQQCCACGGTGFAKPSALSLPKEQPSQKTSDKVASTESAGLERSLTDECGGEKL
jgi:RecJ-like exonuclease